MGGTLYFFLHRVRGPGHAHIQFQRTVAFSMPEHTTSGLFFETHENMSDSVVTSSPQVMNDVCSFCQTGVADVNILTVSCAFIYAYLELLRM